MTIHDNTHQTYVQAEPKRSQKCYKLFAVRQQVEAFIVAPLCTFKYIRSTKSPEDALADATETSRRSRDDNSRQHTPNLRASGAEAKSKVLQVEVYPLDKIAGGRVGGCESGRDGGLGTRLVALLTFSQVNSYRDLSEKQR
jgi:hypothetical protein